MQLTATSCGGLFVLEVCYETFLVGDIVAGAPLKVMISIQVDIQESESF